MPINGKLRRGNRSGDPTELPSSIVLRSAWTSAPQFSRTKVPYENEAFTAVIADFRFRHSNDSTAGPGGFATTAGNAADPEVLSICLARYYHDRLTTKCLAASL